MSWRAAKSITVLRDEINRAYPNRDKASDGIIGDQAHAARASDHNPDGNGVVHAIDIDKDGIPADAIVEKLRRMGEYGDRRLKYIIWNRRIYSSKTNWKGEAYTGSNAHDKHFHVSVTAAHGDDTGPWHLFDNQPNEDDMPLTSDEKQWITDTVFNITKGWTDQILKAVAQIPGVGEVTTADEIADELAERLKA